MTTHYPYFDIISFTLTNTTNLKTTSGPFSFEDKVLHYEETPIAIDPLYDDLNTDYYLTALNSCYAELENKKKNLKYVQKFLYEEKELPKILTKKRPKNYNTRPEVHSYQTPRYPSFYKPSSFEELLYFIPGHTYEELLSKLNPINYKDELPIRTITTAKEDEVCYIRLTN